MVVSVPGMPASMWDANARYFGAGAGTVMVVPGGKVKAGRQAAADAYDGLRAGCPASRRLVLNFEASAAFCERSHSVMIFRASVDTGRSSARAARSSAARSFGGSRMARMGGIDALLMYNRVSHNGAITQ
jgi:hypothetical protein